MLGTLSVLGISLMIWIILLLNPQFSYANKTQFDFITLHHNFPLQSGTEQVLRAAIDRIKTSALYQKDLSIDLCLNEGSIYPSLNPFARGPMAYAMLNKSVIKNCDINFDAHLAETKWAINQYEHRKFDLIWLIVHEFTHNLQFYADPFYIFRHDLGQINWKLEGHAEYISRSFKNDGLLPEKIKKLITLKQQAFTGLPVFEREDGTMQIYPYFKYAVVT